ncbi:DUF3800 domain-containing protein [Cytobacillus pseudoceanisediminis]|uniref:DUF3800 domain-containing protein n=1 Tax=Cytobacillus pseudoceanisediminis TaxID=3051614 RepID=UPI00218B7D8F|nr:DUF3800 domain-containing protein [Cytobacillus pseudoceanisediminis]UQX52297.1 DUF3800 domain-containing protein [Cytobacillus pseudoceanisediminis]
MDEKEKLLSEIEDEVLNESDEDSAEEEVDPIKEAERLKKAAALWEAVQNGETKHVTQKVGAILNRFDETRNSDIALMIKFWEIFEGHTGNSVSHQQLFKLQRLTTIARARAKIQNEYKLYLPTDEKVRKYRKALAEEESEYQIATKPALPIVHIYADETGKTDEYLIVGGFWILDDLRNGQIKKGLIDWINEFKEILPNFPSEFHFKDLKNDGSNIEAYKEFFNKAVGLGDVFSFKAIGVNRTKLRKVRIQDLLDELYYQMIRIGIDHEVRTGRIDFPKQISYIKDKEGDESRFHIEQLSQKITDNLKMQYEDRLKLNTYMPIDSKIERFLQVADLFTASINRRINFQPKNENRNAKDDLADYILELLNLQIVKYDVENYNELIKDETDGDMSILYLFD